MGQRTILEHLTRAYSRKLAFLDPGNISSGSGNDAALGSKAPMKGIEMSRIREKKAQRPQITFDPNLVQIEPNRIKLPGLDWMTTSGRTIIPKGARLVSVILYSDGSDWAVDVTFDGQIGATVGTA